MTMLFDQIEKALQAPTMDAVSFVGKEPLATRSAVFCGTGSIAMSKFIFGASSSGTDDLTVQDLTIT